MAGVSTAAQRALLSGQRRGAPAAARCASSAPARASAAAQRRSRSSACAARSSRTSSRPRARLAASPARPAAASRASSCGGRWSGRARLAALHETFRNDGAMAGGCYALLDDPALV